MKFHHLHFRAFCHATEDIEKVKKALSFLCGYEYEYEPGSPRTPAPPQGLKIKITATEGYFGNPLHILEARLSNSSEIKSFWQRLREAGIIDQILQDLPQRVDEFCNFYIRFDKQSAYSGVYELARNGDEDVIAARARLAVYPAKREAAVERMKLFLESKV